MSISKVSTLTSGALAIADSSLLGDKSFNISQEQLNKKNVLVVEKNTADFSNYDDQVCAIQKLGFRVIISSSFSNVFTAKSINMGILPVEISDDFLSRIKKRSKTESVKLFIDFKGQELMLINTGEKEYFELTDYNRERLGNGKDEMDSLYAIWDELDYSYKHDEILNFPIE